ncbi:hypothetical protein SAMN05660226_00139 [Parapedobacter luteus]|uniref:Thioredoxin n=1 Tax=Parapedobacter luteus TaxID=623280 RepID=A0A1T4ZW46_9SPHI|nr:hypothetical protein SAMN05660226_00139 [Parapedobacter luteus]
MNILRSRNTNFDISDQYDVHLLPTKILTSPTEEILKRYVGSDMNTRFIQDLQEIFKH